MSFVGMDRGDGSYALRPDIPVSGSDAGEPGLLEHYGVFQGSTAHWQQKANHSPYASPLAPTHNHCSVDSAPDSPARDPSHHSMGNDHAQHVRPTEYGAERSDELIMNELERLYSILRQSERYQRYREKQPALTQPEMIARERAEKEEAARNGHLIDEKKATWPEFLEDAFWRGKACPTLFTALFFRVYLFPS